MIAPGPRCPRVLAGREAVAGKRWPGRVEVGGGRQTGGRTLGGGAALDWTPTAADVFQATDAISGAVMTCIANSAYNSNTTPAVSHARCAGLADGP